jgi:hypothetical protein
VTNRPLRPLAIFAVLAGGDYFLWNWSLEGNHDIFALIAGLTLVPLILTALWLLALAAMRFFADVAREGPGQMVARARAARNRRAPIGVRASARLARRRRAPAASASTDRRARAVQHSERRAGAGSASAPASSSKLAA